jgi:undecaprenyl-diphosphatase
MHYSDFLQYISTISNNISNIIMIGGYPVIFLMVVLEGLPLIGTLVPGHVAIIAGGFLAHSGILNVWTVTIVCIVAAVVGDATGFYLGRHYGMRLIDRFKRYLFIRDEHITKAQDLLTKHTGKAMIIGRLSPITRALMPFLVGTGSTSHIKFWIFNTIGAILWVVPSIMLGYVFSLGFHAISGYFGKAVLSAIVIGGLIIWGYRFVNLRFHIFRRYELFALIINVISLITLAFMIKDALIPTSFMTNFDIWVNGFMNTHVGANLIIISEFLGSVATVGIPTSVGIMIGLIYIFHGRWRSAAVVLLSVMSAFFLFAFMKDFFMRQRPDNALILLTDPSFPSGHATMIAAFVFVCAYLFAPKMRNWVWRELFIVFCVLMIIIVGLSRIILNVHWVSDVVAGWSLGIFCATASIILVRYAVELVRGRRV